MILKHFKKKDRPQLTEGFRILLFFGSPRTGSTLLGHVLNRHPQVLVANEYRFLQKIIRENKSVEKEIKCLQKTAWRHFDNGLENKKKFMDFQSRWSSVEVGMNLKKKPVCILGDKKAGGNVRIYLENPEKTEVFLKNYRPFILQIIRHPVDAAYSSMKAFDMDFQSALIDQIERTKIGFNIGNKYLKSFHFLYYENLLEKPDETLSNLCRFFNIDENTEWISESKKMFSMDQSFRRSSEDVLLARDVVKRYLAQDVYSFYQDIIEL